MNCILPASSKHGIFQARLLEWVSIPYSRGSSQSWDQLSSHWRADSLPLAPSRKCKGQLSKFMKTISPTFKRLTRLFLIINENNILVMLLTLITTFIMLLTTHYSAYESRGKNREYNFMAYYLLQFNLIYQYRWKTISKILKSDSTT